MLEVAVLTLREQNQTEQEIFSMVQMILQGWIVDGQLTPEYIALANQAIQTRKMQEEPESNLILNPSIKRSHGLVPPKCS
jgi:hypothetical protein